MMDQILSQDASSWTLDAHSDQAKATASDRVDQSGDPASPSRRTRTALRIRSDDKTLVAVFGASGNQAPGVVRALTAQGRSKLRAPSRASGSDKGSADEIRQATAAIQAAQAAGVRHLIWPALPNMEKISEGSSIFRNSPTRPRSIRS